MGMNDELVYEPVFYTYAEAAKRVGRDDRSIRKWRRDGMPMEWRTDDAGQRFRVVEESVLLKWFQERLKASPTHFYRMRRAAVERGETPPPLPDRFTLGRKHTPTRAQDDAQYAPRPGPGISGGGRR
ncbi:hypothetical protein AB0N64_06300 [Microbacterium sp. NPDC089318]